MATKYVSAHDMPDKVWEMLQNMHAVAERVYSFHLGDNMQEVLVHHDPAYASSAGLSDTIRPLKEWGWTQDPRATTLHGELFERLIKNAQLYMYYEDTSELRSALRDASRFFDTRYYHMAPDLGDKDPHTVAVLATDRTRYGKMDFEYKDNSGGTYGVGRLGGLGTFVIAPIYNPERLTRLAALRNTGLGGLASTTDILLKLSQAGLHAREVSDPSMRIVYDEIVQIVDYLRSYCNHMGDSCRMFDCALVLTYELNQQLLALSEPGNLSRISGYSREELIRYPKQPVSHKEYRGDGETLYFPNLEQLFGCRIETFSTLNHLRLHVGDHLHEMRPSIHNLAAIFLDKHSSRFSKPLMLA